MQFNKYQSEPFQARKTDRKLNRVALMVSVKDVKMTDLETGAAYFDISIYRSEKETNSFHQIFDIFSCSGYHPALQMPSSPTCLHSSQ